MSMEPQVVDVEPQPSAAKAPTALKQDMECVTKVTDILAESMASLNLGRK